MEATSCCACLVAEEKLYSVEENNMKQALQDLTDITVNISTIPQYLCYLCRALVLKFAAFREVYRYSHLILLKEIRKGQGMDGEIIHQENNVRKMTGLLLTISKTTHIDINNKGESDKAKTSEVEDEENLSEIEIKKETKPEVIKKHVVRVSAAQNELLNNIVNFDNKINIKEEFHYTLQELDPVDESGNVYSNKKVKRTHEDNIRHNVMNKTSETYTKKNDKQNGNKANNKLPTKEVKQRNKNNKTRNKTCVQDRDDVRNIVFPEPDKYSSKISKKTLQDYEEFANKYKMKVDFFVTKEEQMNTFLARRETESYKKATYKCEMCYVGFMTNSAYSNHVKKHEKHKNRPFECEFCHRYFSNNRTRLDHLESHRVKYTCLQCGEVLTIKWCLDRHFKVHAGLKYECKTCFKLFRIKSVYYKHIRMHGSTNGSSSSLATCPFCDDAFNGPAGLKVHKQLVHPEAQDCFCSGCGRQFSNEAARTAHEHSCSADNSPCVRCGASFPTDERLAEHVAEKHTTIYTCECGQRFRNIVTLKSHRYYNCLEDKSDSQANNHSGPRLCELCGITVSNVYVLRDHMRIHSGEKPYKCTECEKTFRLHTLLQIHMVTHTDERRYKCSLCPKAFRQPAHLRSHMFSHTKERPYACNTCPKRYTGQTALREHVDTAHRGLPPRQRAKKQDKQE